MFLALEKCGRYVKSPFELSQEVNRGVPSVSVVPTGLWVCGASIPSDDGVSRINRVIET
jgi:hypothetical protein